jgi:two-component system sensor histidine kinase KdpD
LESRFIGGRLADLLEIFSRGQENDGRAPGVGLGLAIAKGFLTAQGGSITAINRKDAPGASVTAMLPIAED